MLKRENYKNEIQRKLKRQLINGKGKFILNLILRKIPQTKTDRPRNGGNS